MKSDPHQKTRKRFSWLAVAPAVLILASTVNSSSPAMSQQPSATLPPEHVTWYGDPSAPDLSGVWVRADAAGSSTNNKEGWRPWPAPLKGAFATVWKKRMSEAAKGARTDDPVRGCLPPGMPRYMTGTNGPLLIIQTAGRVMLYRDGDPVRRIWLDGRPLPAPKDLEHFSNGTAVGHYEGSDLVTQIVGFKDEPIDSTGVPHSDALTIAERYHRRDANTLDVEVTLTDPKAYFAPMSTKVVYKHLDNPLWEAKEFICTPVTNYHPDAYVH